MRTAPQLVFLALVGGLTGALTEMIFVLPIQWAVLHNSPRLVFQYIASGAEGPAAFHGGWWTGAEGIAWHLMISVGAALFYAIGALRWPFLVRRPALGGMLLGVIAYCGMTFVVMPLSRIGFVMPRPDVLTLVSFAVHLFAFGVPIAIIISAVVRRKLLPP